MTTTLEGVGLAVRGLVTHFDTFTLDHVDLTVPRGTVMGLVGANGSGKTTTIRIALGMTVPEAGQVAIPGMDRVGVVLDQPYFPAAWRIRSVEKHLAPFYPAWSAARFAELLDTFGLSPEAKVGDLSRGMGMKLQIAVALAHDPELLILDEPTSGLDPLARDELIDMLAAFMEDETHSVLFSTHITTDLERIADHVTVLDRGRVLTSAATTDLLDSFRVVKGGPGELTDTIRARTYGLRVRDTGFEGLALTTDADTWPGNLLLDPPTLDEIVTGIAKGRPEQGANSAAGPAR